MRCRFNTINELILSDMLGHPVVLQMSRCQEFPPETAEIPPEITRCSFKLITLDLTFWFILIAFSIVGASVVLVFLFTAGNDDLSVSKVNKHRCEFIFFNAF